MAQADFKTPQENASQKNWGEVLLSGVASSSQDSANYPEKTVDLVQEVIKNMSDLKGKMGIVAGKGKNSRLIEELKQAEDTIQKALADYYKQHQPSTSSDTPTPSAG